MTTRFVLDQRFRASLLDVEGAFLDPELFERMQGLPSVGRPQLLDQEIDGDTVRQRVRLTFTGHLAPTVTAVVDPDKLTWVQDTAFDLRMHRGTVTVVPDHYADRFSCRAVVELWEADGQVERVTTGEMRVRFPLVGSRVERAIVSGLHENAAAEERIVQGWLDEQSEGRDR